MNRVELLVTGVIATILLFAFYNYNTQKSSKTPKISKIEKRSFYQLSDQNLTEAVVISYIEDVINNGSNRLGFQKEGMEGGFVPKKSAKDVACYVYELSGKKCSKAYAKEAALLFSSNCAGCHGNDGKGIHGTFPNLTKFPLLGLQKKYLH